MNRFLRWYYKNKIKFWIRVLIILGIYLIILLFNNISKQSLVNNNTKDSVNTYENSGNNSLTIKNRNSIMGGYVSQENLQIANNIIDEFIKNCNSKQVEKAYNMLSDECKETVFSSIEMFKTYYIDKVFNISKTYTIENWSNSSYKIEYKNSILATGGKESNEYVRDYITVVTASNGETKLNINNYIGRTYLNKTKNIDNIVIKIVSKDTFFDYEIYNIEVSNNSKEFFLLDNLCYSTNIYIKDNNNINYYAYINELTKEMLTVKPSETKVISIRFTNSYSTDRKITSINFNTDKNGGEKILTVEL